MNKQKAFTMIELIASIIVIGILSIYAAPKLINSGYDSKTLQDQFVSELQRAQLLAINNQDRRMEIIVLPTGYSLAYLDKDGLSSVYMEYEFKYPRKSQLALVDTTTSTTSLNFNIDFDSSGRASFDQFATFGTDDKRTLTITDPDRSETITIEPEGYIYVQ